MSYELVFTSVPKGLKPGSRGFSAVAFTEGMPANHVQFCESISGYVHLFAPHDPQYATNPTVFSHLLPTLGGVTLSVLSRVASYGTDYTGRTNKLAHHVMVSAAERTSCGPALVMRRGGLFVDDWTRPPCFLPQNRITLQEQEIASYKAMTWERLLGDAGYAGMLAQAFLDAPSKPCFILFEPGMDLLPLLAEAQALLPEHRRWDVTFSTYFNTLPVGIECSWRCCLPDSDALKVARRTPNALVFDLPNRRVEGREPSVHGLADVARTGNRIAPVSIVSPGRPIVQVRNVPRQTEAIERSRSPQQPRYRELASMPVDRAAVPPEAPRKVRALRPRHMWVGLGVVAAILALLVSLSIVFRRADHTASAQASDGTNTPPNVPTSANEPPQATDYLPDLDKDGPVASNTGTLTNLLPDGATGQPKEVEAARPAEETVGETDKNTPSVVRNLSVKQLPVRIDLPADATVRFYSDEGAFVAHTKMAAGADGPSERYVAVGRVRKTLARELDGKLAEFDGLVQIIEVATPAQGTIYVSKSKPLLASVTRKQLFQEYEIRMKDTDASKLLGNYLSPDVSRTLIGKGSVSIPRIGKDVKMSISVDKESNASVLFARAPEKNAWTEARLKVTDDIAQFEDKLRIITNALNVVTVLGKDISAAREALGRPLKMTPADAGDERKRNRKALEELILECIRQYVGMKGNDLFTKGVEPSEWKDVQEALGKQKTKVLSRLTDEKDKELREKAINDAFNSKDVGAEWLVVKDSIEEGSVREFAVFLGNLLTKTSSALTKMGQDYAARVRGRKTELSEIDQADVSIDVLVSEARIISGREQ